MRLPFLGTGLHLSGDALKEAAKEFHWEPYEYLERLMQQYEQRP